jgi:hypothetical protein
MGAYLAVTLFIVCFVIGSSVILLVKLMDFKIGICDRRISQDMIERQSAILERVLRNKANNKNIKQDIIIDCEAEVINIDNTDNSKENQGQGSKDLILIDNQREKA